VFEIFWGRITNEGSRFSCPLGTFVVAFREALSVGLYCIDSRLVGVQHKEGSVSGVVLVETNFALFKNDVFVRFDNVKLLVVFAVVSYREFIFNLGEG
jgi:hypothetical protein